MNGGPLNKTWRNDDLPFHGFYPSVPVALRIFLLRIQPLAGVFRQDLGVYDRFM